MSRRHPKRRQGKGERFARLPVSVLEHSSVTTLDHAAFRVLVLFAGAYHGGNNGALGITASQAAERGIRSDNTFYRALATLEQRGLISRTYPASRVPPRPAMYSLEWLPLNETPYTAATTLPSHWYRKWQPEIAS